MTNLEEEEAMRRSHATLQRLLERCTEPIFCLDLELRYTGFNRAHGEAMRALYGTEVALGKPLLSLMTVEEDRATAEGNLRRVLAGESITVQAAVGDERRARRLFEVVHDPVLGEDGSILGALVLARDVTESRTAEALAESESRLRSLFDGMLEGYAHCRMLFEDGRPVDWVYLGVNPAFVRMTGLVDVVGKRVSEVLPGLRETNPELFETYGRVAATGQPETFESHVRSLGVWFSISAYCPARGEFVAVFDDLAQHKRAETELSKLSRAVEASPATVVITDLEGRIEYVNPKFTAVTGYTREEVIGQNPRVLKSGETPPEAYRQLWETLRAGNEWRGEFHNRRKNGELFWEMATISSVKDASGAVTHYVAVKEDITESKRAAAELARYQEQLRQAQKMEAVGRLAGGVAHDFNNLLTVIRGYGELLAETLADDPERQESVAEIVRAADRAATLTRQLLAFSRRQALEARVVDLRSIVDEAEKLLRRLIGEDIELLVIKGDAPMRVKVDSGQMEQVLMNLAVNARDAMPEGGRLTIAVVAEDVAEPLLSPFDLVPAGSYVSLTVTDTGVGMGPETLSHAFEPFFTTKEKGKGTGLGLATVFGIVKQSSGFLSVASEPGAGSTFRVFLPRVTESASPGKVSGLFKAVARGTETILVVEDESALRELTRQLLERQGYRVVTADSCGDALRKAGERSGPIDLLLTDLVMPGPSGLELARELLSRRPETRVLYMSGYSHDVLARQRLAEVGGPFLQKPFKEAELLRRVREVLDQPLRR